MFSFLTPLFATLYRLFSITFGVLKKRFVQLEQLHLRHRNADFSLEELLGEVIATPQKDQRSP
jgi:hypothetical protein